jgi:hypothetical protein
VGWQVGSGGVEVEAHLFFQCIIAWSLPRARGSGYLSFSSPWCFTSTKFVSNISVRSLIRGAHTVCVCVTVAILYPSKTIFKNRNCIHFEYFPYW